MPTSSTSRTVRFHVVLFWPGARPTSVVHEYERSENTLTPTRRAYEIRTAGVWETGPECTGSFICCTVPR